MPDSSLDMKFRLDHGGFDLDIDQSLNLSGAMAVFGPSGAGKSSLLRAIAGLEPATGRIAFDGSVWQNHETGQYLRAHRRPIGMVFQDARLFPHLTVAGNLNYAIRRAQSQSLRDDVVDALDLQPLLDRRAQALSGGERQRVALGRTLLTQPRLLLLDEPLSSLDTDRKTDILPYLDVTLRSFGIPALYVTHSVEEVTQLCQQTLVMGGGRVHAVGPTAEILERLDLEPLTGRFEAGVLVNATVVGQDTRYHLTQIDVDGHRMTVPSTAPMQTGQDVRLRIRARDVSLALSMPSGLSIQNAIPGTVTEIVTDADSAFAEVVIDLGHAHLRSRVTRKSVDQMKLQNGLPVFALIKSASFDHSES